jgi:hypothetical protein
MLSNANGRSVLVDPVSITASMVVVANSYRAIHVPPPNRRPSRARSQRCRSVASRLAEAPVANGDAWLASLPSRRRARCVVGLSTREAMKPIPLALAEIVAKFLW